MQPFDPGDVPHEPRATTGVRWLIAVNVALYFLQLTVLSPVDVRASFGFELRTLLAGSWWTIGTYMFVHAGFVHIALNMYTLWLFGPRIERLWGTGQFVGFYLLCGFGGWFFHLLFVQQGVLIGASAAVMGVMLAYASYWATEQVLLLGMVPVTVRWLVALLVIANLIGGISSDTGAGLAYFAHLGGLATGWAYLRMAGAMNIDRLRQRVAPVADEPDDMPPRAFPRSLPRQRGEREVREVDEIVQQSQAAIAERGPGSQRRPARNSPAGGTSSSELNSLLDKISAHGLDALTQAERTRLEDAARKLRDE